MFKQKQGSYRRYFGNLLNVVVVGLLLVVGVSFQHRQPQATAATSGTLNFQARLLSSSGGIVPDGTYNIEFKVYDSLSSGASVQGACTLNSSTDDCWWVETRTGGNKVTVKNGYLSVNLGSVTAFGSSIPWSQDMYLTMNIGGTGAPSYDGEMTPRIKLTSVPYAQQAGQLAQLTGSNISTLGFATQTAARSILLPDEAGTLCVQNSANCGFAASTGSASYIQNQNAGQQPSSNFWISGNGRSDTSLQAPLIDTATGVALNIGTLNATSINLNQNTVVAGGKNLTVTTGGTFTNASSSLFTAQAISNLATGGSIGTAATTVDIATSFAINQTTGAQTITIPNPTVTTAGRVAYVINTGSVSFTVNGMILAAGNTAVFIWNGTAWTAAGFDSSGGNYIQNQIGSNQTANFQITGTGRANTSIITPLIDTASAVTLNVGTSASSISLNQNVVVAATKSLTVTSGATSLTGLAAGSSTALAVNSGAASNKGIVVAGSSSQSGNLLELQDNGGLVNASFNGAGNQLTLGRISASGTVTQGMLLFSDGTNSNFGLTLQAATQTGSNHTITLPNETGTVCTTGSVCTGYQSALTFNNGITNTSGTVQLGGALTQATTIAAGNAQTLTLTSTLTAGARAAYPLIISQANDATNNNSVGLLQLSNADTGSTAALLNITQVVSGTGITIAGVTTGTGISASAITTGSALSVANTVTTGAGLLFNTTATTLTSGSALRATGSASGALSAYTGSLVNITPTRTLTSGSINDTGNFLNLTRANTVNNAGSTFTVSGALANLQSTCTQTAGTCTDTATILSLNQQYTNASGTVLNVTGAGTGNLAAFDATNTSANGISIDVQSNSSSQYALNVTANNGATTGLYVRADGNVGIGTNAPTALLHVSGGNFLQSGTGTFGTGTGAVSLNGDTTVAATKSLTVTSGATSLTGLAAGSSTALAVTAGAASNKGVVIQGAASQSANLVELQDNGGLVNASFNAAGNQLTLGRVAASGTVTQGKLVLADGTTDNFSLTLQSAVLGQNTVVTLPDPGAGTATVCYQNSSACGFTVGSGTAFLQGGNTFSGTTDGTLGTKNNGNLVFITNNTTKLTLSTAGDLTFAQSSTLGVSATNGTLTVNSNGTGALTIDSGTTGAVNIGTGANAKIVSVGNTNTTSSLNLNAGTGSLNIGNDSLAKTTTINIGADATGADVIAVGSSNTGSTTTIQGGTGVAAISLQASTSGVIVVNDAGNDTDFRIEGDTNVNLLYVDASTDRIGIGINNPSALLHVSGAGGGASLFRVTDSTATARDVFDIADGGAATFRNQADSTAAFQVQNAAGSAIFNVDTTNSKVGTPNSAVASNAFTLATGDSSTTTTGGLTIKTGNATGAAAGNITIDNGTGNTSAQINIGNSAQAHTINIASSASGDNDILLGSSNAGSTIAIEGGTAGGAIQIGAGNTSHGIQIGTGTGVQTVAVGSTNSTSSTTINGATVGINGNTTLTGLGGATPATALTVNNDTSGDIAGDSFGIQSATTYNPTSPAGGLIVSAIQGITTSSASATNLGSSAIQGGQFYGQYFGTSTAPSVRGFDAAAWNITTGTITTATGGLFGVVNLSTGTITTATAIQVNALSNGGTIGTNYGIHVANQTGGTINSNFGLAVDDQTGGTIRANLVVGSLPASGTWSIYNSSASDNAFAGNLTVAGTAAPTASLSFGNGANRSINVNTASSGAGNNLTVSAGAASGSGAAAAGGALTLQGGAANGTGAGNGGNVVINGGAGVNGGTTGLVSLQSGNLTVAGTGALVTASTIQYVNGTADANNALVCRNTTTGQLTACTTAALTGTAFIQGGNSFNATAVIGTLDGSNGLQIVTGSGGPNGRAFFDTSNNLFLGNAGSAGTAAAPNNFSILGTTSSAAAAGAAGGSLTVRSGAGTSTGSGSAGGDLTVQGGNAGGNGTVNRNGGTLTLDSGSKLLAGTSTVNLGATNATTINIGHSGITTTVTGGLTQLTGAVSLTANASSSFTTAAGTLSLQGFGATSLTTAAQSTASTASAAISITTGNATGTTSTAGGVAIDVGTSTSGAPAITIGASTNSIAKTIAIGGSNGTGDITLGSSSASQQVLIGNGAGASTVSIANTTVSGATVSIAGGANTSATSVSIANGATAAATTVSILSGVGTASTASLLLGNNTRVTQIDLGNIAAAAARTINVGTGNNVVGIDTINIGTGNTSVANGKTINIGTGTPSGSGSNTINIGSSTLSSTTTLNAGTGLLNFNTTQAQFSEITGTRTLTVQTRGTGGTAGTGLLIQGGSAAITGTAATGGLLTLQGGNANGASGNANGANVSITGGTGFGTGVRGLVVIDTPTFNTTANDANCYTSGALVAASCTIAVSSINNSAAVIVGFSATAQVATVPDPTITTAGRIVYITAANGSSDFTLRFNTSTTPIDIAMRANNTATLIWNGADWTAAGASSSTDLQSAYNNTLTSAGGAELVLNASGGAADGLTIRNNATTPISGGILEVQSSIGTNLFSVNNFGTELAANGGAETLATFGTNWSAGPVSATIARTTGVGNFATGQAGVQVTTTTTLNSGVRNNLSGNPVNTIGAQYQVSFTAKSNTNGTPIDVLYSRNGGTNTDACTSYSSQTLSNTIWTKVTCTITISSSTAATDPDLIIRKTDNTTSPIFYIDNLSFMRNDTTTQPSNVQIGGGINGGPITLFTLDRSTAPPVAAGDNTYLGSMYYDTTTGSIQCYEADGWGACGSAPNNIITLTPEYTGAVLNGSGIGTMTADFCSNEASVLVVGTLCANHEVRNFYRWTSPQASSQTYTIYVNYKLPSTFKTFNDANTIKLTTLTTDTTLASASLQIFRKNVTSNVITSCGAATTINSSSNSWQQTSFGSDETACGFVGSDYVVFKIDVTARSSASIYVENLDFTYTNR